MISCCPISTSTSAWSTPCCARAASKSARVIFWARYSNEAARAGRQGRATGYPGAPTLSRTSSLRQLVHQLLDAAEQRLLRARDVGEAQLERTVETIFLGLSLNELQHALRIDLILLLEQDVAVAGAGIDLAD